jgi:tripartite-type tricarboxylate transporter receptor subunit TctC
VSRRTVTAFAAAVALGAGLASPGAHAQSAGAGAYPARPIRLIVAYAAGGVGDLVGRLVAKVLAKEFGQPVVVENHVGAGGTIGTQACANAEPDGYTLCMGSPSSIVVAPMVVQGARYDAHAFAPVSLIASLPNMLVASPKLGVRSVDDWLRWTRANPGAAWGTSGVGTTNHLTAIYLNRQFGTKIEHVPYKGGVLAIQDVLAGHIPMAMDQLSTTLPHIRAGTLVPIAVSGSARLAILPDVPTLAETLLPKYRNDSYQGVFAPARVPAAIVERLGAALQKAVASDESLRAQLVELGGVPIGNSPAQFRQIVEESTPLLRELVVASGIVPK